MISSVIIYDVHETHHQVGLTVNTNMAVRLLSLPLTHASPARDNHDSFSHSAMGETEFYLCKGHRSEQYIQVAPSDPPKLPSFGRCVCICVSPRPGSSPGPGKSLGHTDTDLSSATLRLIPDFMGARAGGRVRAFAPSWGLLSSSPNSSGPYCSTSCAAAGCNVGGEPFHRDTVTPKCHQ